MSAASRLNRRWKLPSAEAQGIIELTLREMTADDVLRSIDFYVRDAERLVTEAAPFEAMSERLQAGEAQIAASELLRIVRVSMPQWSKHPGMGFEDALRRFWPGGRPAA